MRLWLSAVVLISPLAVAALFPRDFVAFVYVLVAVAVCFFILDRREMSLLAPLALSEPLLVHFFPFGPLGRFLLFILFSAIIWWYITDLKQRRKGAALSLSRMQFYFFAGLFSLTATAFAAAGDPELRPVALSSIDARPIILLGLVALAAALGIFTLRSAADRIRALNTSTLATVDSVLVSLFLVETFIGLSFLPLSPFTMAAITVVFCWGILRIVFLCRGGALNKKEVARTIATVFVFFAILLVSVPWISSR